MTYPLTLPNSSVGSRKKDYPHNHLMSLLDGFIDFSELEKHTLTFNGLAINSKNVHEGFLFFACASVNNNLQHGIAYAGSAINSGASCILWEPTHQLNELPVNCSVDGRCIPLIRIENLSQKIGEIASRFYQNPSQNLKIVGITGTNGKTSIAHLIAHFITCIPVQTMINNERSGAKKCAVIGTLGNGLYGKLEKSQYTTPDAVTVQALMAQYKKSQADTLLMEVSSHALSQGRVNGIAFDTAVFTNLTHDHLDYHYTMQSYGEEKLKLFQVPSLKQIVLNQDDELSLLIYASIEKHSELDEHFNAPKIVSYSKKDKNADYFAKDFCFDHTGTAFVLCTNNEEYYVNSPLIGDFNIDNLLATIAVLEIYHYPLEHIIKFIKTITTILGRMEKVSIESINPLALIVVDFAHTPDALEKALESLKMYVKGKLYCIFGCGGDRDRSKRPLMAKMAEQIADIVIVTSDNPRNESEEQIVSEIMSGFNDTTHILIEYNREKAIQQTLAKLNSDDVLLIAGKGHEHYQEVKGQCLPFSDQDTVRSFYHLRNEK